jgi:hypothetical protein
MTRQELIAAAFASAGLNATFLPVQVQKLFFLIDREVANRIEGPYFSFAPYDYGPFDSSVYDELENMKFVGHATIDMSGRYRRYSLTDQGFIEGSRVLSSLPEDIRQFFSDLTSWIRKLDFQQLVAAIYNKYPDMKVNSIFR